MKAKLARLVIGVAFAVLFMLDMVKPLDARGSQATPFDAVMKINQLEKLFTLIDDRSSPVPNGAADCARRWTARARR